MEVEWYARESFNSGSEDGVGSESESDGPDLGFDIDSGDDIGFKFSLRGW